MIISHQIVNTFTDKQIGKGSYNYGMYSTKICKIEDSNADEISELSPHGLNINENIFTHAK